MTGAAAFDPSTLDNYAYKVLVKEATDIAIFFLNPQGEIVSWNDGAAQIKGYNEKEVIGQHYRMLFPDEAREKNSPEKELEQAEKEGYYTGEGFRQRKDGTHFRAHVSLTRQLDENGKLLGFFKITRDISERYYREQEAILKTEEIARLSELKDEFISIASHELKNPLTTVKAYLELLKQSFDTIEDELRPLKNYVTKSYNQLTRLEKLIAEMLNASRVGAGKLQLNLSEFDLNRLVIETVENTKRIYRKHTLEVSTTAGRIMVHADRDRVEQVVVNYLTNAIRYSPEGSIIKVGVRSLHGEGVEVCVKDQGIGIAQAEKDQVFNRFFRSEGKGKKAGGLGLGLYIVKGIINQHGGKVSVNSEIGKGSTFYFTIPLKPRQ